MEQKNQLKGNGNEDVSQMFADKQERIARQIALQSAVETVTVNPASQIKDPKIIGSKVLEIADLYYKWICDGRHEYR